MREARLDAKLPAPRVAKGLSEEAARALEDFGFWRLRYLGRRSTPWQEEAALRVVEWARSPETELVVVNCPPGSGKSTLFTHDIPTWMICRDRTVRILLGSRTQRLAAQYSRRIRTTLGRTKPLPAGVGRPEAAAACLAVDYGRFKSDIGDLWRQNEFTVMGINEDPSDDKEPTVAAYGMDSEFLGARAGVVIWDDLVVGSILRNGEMIEEQRRWWDEEGETRVEPGGLVILQGQRMGADDLYRYALDQTLDDESTEPRYRHVLYPAHFEDRCTGDHGKDAAAYPDGCLLDPVRLPWKGRNGLLTIQTNKAEKYRVQYQQEDVDPASVLVPKLWVDGGKDTSGVEFPGCWDKHRDLCGIPKGLSAPWLSIVTADPSPTKFWSIQWWIYHPASEQRFLMDLCRQAMDAPDFLDWNETTKTFSGLADDWQARSKDLGYPIKTWIVEANVAQRFLLQYDHVKRWQRIHQVDIVPHQTHRNKVDPEFGVQMIANRWRYGNVRLPGAGLGRLASMKLVDEVTRYPDASYDDCVMAQWFLEYHLPRLAKPKPGRTPQTRRPSWMRRAA